ncbi:CDP-alcohol phosphatidyltransferase family protein [Facklamia miroungae]|uniref:Phosphatidylserine synthase n=1 Tax=Facklamia miroungae TaxID=120956 RepID=A0A1G7U5S3_9LACT|nr:hypothetical protein [Facklamia miroungae]NKZ29926.1 hypothetical protein [Facklamia miroungae]SDG42916.1 Phosphatidylserine synthase [Facklamia miroungae]
MLGDLHQSNLVILVQLVFSIVGLGFAYIGAVEYGLISMMIAAILNEYSVDISEQFDQTDAQLAFSTEFEVLADFLSFGMIPVGLLLTTTRGGILGIVTIAIYLTAVSIRLAHFNRPLEFQTYQMDDDLFYLGLPLISVAVIFPILYLLSYILAPSIFSVLVIIIMLGLAVGYVIAKPIPRLKKEWMTYLIFGVIFMILMYILLGIFK